MALKEETKLISEVYLKNCYKLSYNAEVFDIYEGNLCPYVDAELKLQFSPETYSYAQHRIAPINLERRLIQKLSTLYAQSPTREIIGSPLDQTMVIEYINRFSMDVQGQIANEFFNQFKSFAWEPYLDSFMQPRLRAIPSDRFFVYSNDPIDPMRVTHFAKVMGKKQIASTYTDKGKVKTDMKEVTLLYVYTDEEFLIQDTEGNVYPDLMSQMGSDGSNPYGKIPFVYSVRSTHNLMPTLDTDLLKMVKLFPVLLTDLNYAVMYQSFSVTWGIDVESENLKMSPNAFWNLKSDPTRPESKPQVGTIKPSVDTDKVIALIQAEMSMWLQSRNVKPGSIGALTPENFASGISKMVDEMDTAEDRSKQVPFFVMAEESLFDLIIDHMHPVWLRTPGYFTKSAFSPKADVKVSFPEQKPKVDQSVMIDNAIKLKNAGIISKEKLIKMVFPDMDDEQVMEMMSDAREENTIVIEEPTLPDGNETPEV